jgi:hypothetical protein
VELATKQDMFMLKELLASGAALHTTAGENPAATQEDVLKEVGRALVQISKGESEPIRLTRPRVICKTMT